jgi:hypothetical protein
MWIVRLMADFAWDEQPVPHGGLPLSGSFMTLTGTESLAPATKKFKSLGSMSFRARASPSWGMGAF